MSDKTVLLIVSGTCFVTGFVFSVVSDMWSFPYLLSQATLIVGLGGLFRVMVME
jgi:hypothetical protein